MIRRLMICLQLAAAAHLLSYGHFLNSRIQSYLPAPLLRLRCVSVAHHRYRANNWSDVKVFRFRREVAGQWLMTQVKLFVDVFTNNISGFSLLGASTQKQLTEVKGKLVDGLKVGALC